jgi:hypothetical protein
MVAKKPTPRHVAAPKQISKPSAQRQSHSLGVTATPHTPQRATTLMRSAVQKPTITSASVIKSHNRTDLLSKVPMQTVAPKMSYVSINPVRHQRAERMIQSQAVSRYAQPDASVSSFSPNPKPITRPIPHYKASPSTSAKPSLSNRLGVDVSSAASTAHSSDDIFELALAEATSHEQTYNHRAHRKKKHGHALRYVAGSFSVLLLLGFLTYQNAPSLSLKIASYRAGLHATMPAHQPAGFTFSYLDYQPGHITANFNSLGDGRQYNITQKASNWDSQALLSNFVTSANSAYKTYQRAGRTVYLLSNNTATWVDSGIWYTVDGNSSLSSNQLLDLASSM